MNGCGKILIEDYSGNIHGECGEDGLCPACAEKLEARVRELEAWKRDTEESWRITLEDRGAHDEMHCSCVPVLRERVRELEEWQRQMVEKASAKSLNGYRELAAKCAALEAENERLREALEAVEWADPYCEERFSFCPWCHRSFGIGHAPDCQRQLALMVTTDRGEG